MSHPRDIHIGNATVPYGYTSDGRCGWRLPGGGVTSDYREALRIATAMARLLA